MMQHERGYIICIINMLTGLYVTPAVCMCFCQHCNGILFYMCSMSSGQLGKDITSLYTVNKNKHNRRTFIKSSISVQPLLTHTCLDISVAVITSHLQTLIFLVI